MDEIFNLSEEDSSDDDVDLNEILEELNNVHFMSSLTYKETQQRLAQMKLKEDELQSIYHLMEAHCPSFRFRASALYEKSALDKSCNTMPMVRYNFSFKCPKSDINEEVVGMLEKVEEMPKEWTIVQLTPSFNIKQSVELSDKNVYTNPLHITVFNCGQNSQMPVRVTVGAPKDFLGNNIEVMRELKTSLKMMEMKTITGCYAEFKMKLNEGMKDITKVVQMKWLKEWRILLIGKYVDPSVEEDLDLKLDNVLKELGLEGKVSQRSRILLRYIAKGQCYLDAKSMKKAVCHTMPDISLEEQVSLIMAMRKTFPPSYNYNKRHPIILVVEESLDSVPWEMIDVLKEHPVSRMPSLHFTYALYKEHENDIVDGWKIIEDANVGAYVLNPNLDLMKMHNRLKSFFEYWTPSWKSIIGRKPSTEEYCDLITSADIYCYNGHGDGLQYINGNKLTKLRVKAVVLLFGCKSVSLSNLGPQCEPFGSYQTYITACSPCIVGTLWTVTDTDTDILATDFISRWIPSDSPVHWRNLDRRKWETGNTEYPIKSLPKISSTLQKHEPELLRALLKAKTAARQYITQAACVARGIPVKLAQSPHSNTD